MENEKQKYLSAKSLSLGSVIALMTILSLGCQVEEIQAELIGPTRPWIELRRANICDVSIFETLCFNKNGFLITRKVLNETTKEIERYEVYTCDAFDSVQIFNDLKAKTRVNYTYEPFDKATDHEAFSSIKPKLANQCRISDETPPIAECHDGRGLLVKTRTLNPDGSIDSEIEYEYDKESSYTIKAKTGRVIMTLVNLGR